MVVSGGFSMGDSPLEEAAEENSGDEPSSLSLIPSTLPSPERRLRRRRRRRFFLFLLLGPDTLPPVPTLFSAPLAVVLSPHLSKRREGGFDIAGIDEEKDPFLSNDCVELPGA